jgi:hypothetical protein
MCDPKFTPKERTGGCCEARPRLEQKRLTVVDRAQHCRGCGVDHLIHADSK